MISRTDEMLALVEAGEPVDCEKFNALLALDCVKAGEVFVTEMVADMRGGTLPPTETGDD